MLFSRAALYFDEVARRGSIRRAAAHLHIAPSAVDRLVLQLEEHLGVALFERVQSGLRLTAAGEILVEAIRRWRKDLRRVESHVNDLQGLRRGEISISLVEGAMEFFTTCLDEFKTLYPAITYRIQVAGARGVIDRVLSGDYELGVTFDPPKNSALNIEHKLQYRLGVATRPGHALSRLKQVSLSECTKYPLIIPDETISLRRVINEVWARTLGGEPQYCVVASSVNLIKALVRKGSGIGLTTALDLMAEIEAKELVFTALAESRIPASTLCIISASGRAVSAPAALLARQLSQQLSGIAPD